MPDDEFNVSVAPYIRQTHECSFHSLTTCQGDLRNTDIEVTVIDTATNKTVLDETLTTHDNGFVGLWLPRPIDVTFEVTVAGRTARATNGVYAATKWVVNDWSESLRQELLPDIRVTLIEPGVVDTELPTHITHEAVQKGNDAATVKPDEVAEVIAFVLSRPRHLAINEVLLRPADQLG